MKLHSVKKKYYIEADQTKDIQLAFCNKIDDDLYMQFYWANCRDYFSDVLIAEEQNRRITMYDFSYDGTKSKIDRDKTRIIVKTNNEWDAANLEKNIIILHAIEESNGLEKTIFTRIKKNRYLYEGDSFWLNTTFSLHIYTFLIKCMGYTFDDVAKWDVIMAAGYSTSTEGKYICSFIHNWKEILDKNLKQIFLNPTTCHGHHPVYDEDYYLHNNSGIYTLFNKDAGILLQKDNTYFKRMQNV